MEVVYVVSMPKIIDLFAGAGGLSLGATRAGFDLAAAVEIDPQAIETHKKNFPHSKHLDLNIANLSGSELLDASELKKGELTGLIGGPPCQGFSCIGRREVGDVRNLLFSHFFRLVNETKPAFFVAENVTGIMRPDYDHIRAEALSIVSDEYDIAPTLKISAKDCGAPTIRTRVFFIGARKDRRLNFESMSVAEKKETNVETALLGLPEIINPLWQSEECGWQPLSEWVGTDAERFKKRVEGVIPQDVGHLPSLERYFGENEVSGCQGTRHTEPVIERFRNVTPGQRDIVSKSVRLNPEGFCPTLRAGTDSSKGSYQAVRPIHPRQDRVITPREAARLQGFPDWFVFHRTKWHSFRQIGNSVSPIVAETLLTAIMDKLNVA